MKRKLNFLFLIIFMLLLTACIKPGIKKTREPQKLPVDPKVKIGKLDNGLTYILRQNKKPENRLSLRLAVKAGSIDEDDNQKGLAHLCEHMAFNGTKHFEKDALVSYLESIGMEFGAELNAYTSFDETVYMLSLPTDSADILENGFQVLDDWASNVSYDNEEIDKERGVVHEEWRSGRGAGQRLRDEFLPVLFHGSKYADRLPIGSMDIVDNCTYETLKRYYEDWYRPELQAVIVVGDLELEKMEALVKKYFDDNNNPEKPRKPGDYQLPDHKDTKYVIATDEETPRTTIYIYYKHDIEDKSTIDWYHKNMVKTLFTRMLNSRYRELTQQADPPFIASFAGESSFISSKRFFNAAALVKADGIEKGFAALLTEMKRVDEHGFLQSELDRAKAQALKNFESAFNEREKTKSDRFATLYNEHYLNGEPIPGIEWSWGHVQKLIPSITLDEVNNIASELIIDENRVVIVTGPEKDGLKYPTDEQLSDIDNKIQNTSIEAYKEEVTDAPLVKGLIKPGQTVKKDYIEPVDVHYLELSNGVKIYYKITDFQKDEIQMSAISPGGHSLSSDADFISASYASGIINTSGVGEFDNIALQKKLAGKKVSARPYIGELTEGISGSCSIADFETMLQLTYQYFMNPRKDETAFQSMLARQLALLENRKANPMAALQDTLTATLTQNHFRSRPMTPEILSNELDLDKVFTFYQDRFADADDFTFFFVGNINPEILETLSLKYLGSLPSLPREDKWKDIGEEFPTGLIEKELKAGVDQKSNVLLVYNGNDDWSFEKQKKLNVTKGILDIMLREKIREDESGTYGVRVSSDFERYPDGEFQVFIYFGCDPARAEDLTEKLLGEIEKLKTEGPSDENLSKVKTTEQRGMEKNLQDNRFWLNKLNGYVYNGLDINQIPKEMDIINSFTKEDIQKAAQQYFDKKPYQNNPISC